MTVHYLYANKILVNIPLYQPFNLIRCHTNDWTHHSLLKLRFSTYMYTFMLIMPFARLDLHDSGTIGWALTRTSTAIGFFVYLEYLISVQSSMQKWIQPPACLDHSLHVLNRGLQFYTFFGISIGIKRRLINIAKKITFYFLENVWKCTVFFAFAFKVCKKCYYDPKKIYLEKYQYG